MSSPRPTFRVLKNGYDRFAVDDAIEKYAAEVEDLQNKLKVYEEQIARMSEQMNALQTQYQNMANSLDAEKAAAENIARLSLREANEIIGTAQRNADLIVRQALITAREILSELSRLYTDANIIRESTRAKLEGLIKELDEFRLPKMPEMEWLKKAEEKMR
ncbi:MAG: DivIVA domain-containing protein [Solobacterium sp.]|nr:DivIVA domain-containing protein [Solobacterium sp.]MBQ1382692.1 DivIVA domain-containing protein [Solobacterium sp.]MBQ2690261.1 DivIVA domain-containing protein [Solobacterium sp.]MBQ6592107.1 DivIVA domain-containing protein [Solobacterium sp.]MBR0478603.1 DivIVA domain-containing protein [Solobacterium sp.]